MATTLTQTHPLLSVPFSTDTDFTTLADHCESFATTLIESRDPALRLALCGRLAACLTLLEPTLSDPIPPHLVEHLTVDTLPDTSPHLDADAALLCRYSLALSQLLTGRALLPETEQVLTGLLFELVCYFADELRAPRWLRTADGVTLIDDSKHVN
ncbi:hypothetical protein HPG81_11725 [Salmonella enterica subsp. VII serovar 1,40:g,z51:--]|nr:hypothetical protein [Salmonella enterica subsp. VII str. CFSAN000550]EDU7901914.1 hypothetical protein [Salmonella enterica subsp. houtenae]EEO7412731.1 hypothetical protein [Salmonella enterica]QJY67116.1 hypothetical protein HPG81_11725 [Salmonella enterica subsp. VII serovar 1,40:g,z51:--]HCL5369483.1 hypothetical protein [Salmonella enterica]